MNATVMNPVKAFTLIVLGVGAAIAAFLTHGVGEAAPLFPRPQDVPSVTDPAPAPQYASAVERARRLVRAAVLEQNLPGCRWRSVTAAPASGRKGSGGGTSARGRP
jgi:hypothetical protein